MFQVLDMAQSLTPSGGPILWRKPGLRDVCCFEHGFALQASVSGAASTHSRAATIGLNCATPNGFGIADMATAALPGVWPRRIGAQALANAVSYGP